MSEENFHRLQDIERSKNRDGYKPRWKYVERRDAVSMKNKRDAVNSYDDAKYDARWLKYCDKFY
jgi:hypothetical protein